MTAGRLSRPRRNKLDFWSERCRLPFQPQGDLAIYASDLPPQRIIRLFYLGLGLAKLLQVFTRAGRLLGVILFPGVFTAVVLSYSSGALVLSFFCIVHHGRAPATYDRKGALESFYRSEERMGGENML